MKLSLSIKVVVVASVVLLCTGVALYSFMRLNSVEQRQDFDLYTLVPQDAVAVFETDRMMELLESVDEMESSKDGYHFQLSELLGCIRTFLDTWVQESPHALSKQMNKVLISFHHPATSSDEVLYCALGTGDYQRIQAFVGQYAPSSFPVKSFEYQGEVIRIYPLRDGHFLAMYLTKDFLALSFQKRLLEQVIDARHKKKALMQDDSFQQMYASKQRNVVSTLYVRMGAVPMGLESGAVSSRLNLGEWMAFNLKVADTAVYCLGVSYESDSIRHSFVNTLRKQQNISGYAGDYLPASTLLYECWSMTDKQSLWSFTASQDYLSAPYSPYMADRDREWLAYLQDCTDSQAISCVFRPEELSEREPCAVVIIPLLDEAEAKQRFFSWLHATPREKEAPQAPVFNPDYARYPCSQSYRKYLLPRNTLFVRLTGLDTASSHSYACFYRDRLLVAADALSLSAYINAMEKKDLLVDVPFYGDITNTLASSYGFLLITDLNRLSEVPSRYHSFIPTFFLRHFDFFSHFFLALQFTCAEGEVYPNVTLLY